MKKRGKPRVAEKRCSTAPTSCLEKHKKYFFNGVLFLVAW
jgi:hypothetical protein